MKNKTTALLLSIFLGGLGVDRFYLGYPGMGVLKLLTMGCFSVLYIIDIVRIATGSLGPADGTPYEGSDRAAKGMSIDDALRKLTKLRDEGALNDDEYEAMKTNIFSAM